MEDRSDVVPTNVFGDVSIRKARRRRQKLMVRELMYDYANNTTLHGLPYVTRKGLNIAEKTFWLITFLLSISLCFYSISQVWIKWRNSPVIVTVNEQPVSVTTVPFPSVTICPQLKCLVTKYNFTAEKEIIDRFLSYHETDKINSTMKKRIEKYAALKQICNEKFTYDWFTAAYPYKNYSDSSVLKTIQDVGPAFEDIFFRCYIHGKYRSCRSIFNKVVTMEGICYNMNSLAATEIFRSNQSQTEHKYLYTKKPTRGWSAEHGYDYSNFLPTSSYYPMPGAENLGSPDVQVILQINSTERDYICNAINSGYKVYMHHPTDLPQSSQHYYAILNGQVSAMALSFTVLNTSERLTRYDPEVRQCYFSDEKYLKYFKQYTENNCRLECLSNITFSTCGCVKFFMPHETRVICSMKNKKCVRKAQEILQYQESHPHTAICRCLPSCNSVDYEAEILKTDFNFKSFVETTNKIEGFELFVNANYSKLDMYFKKPRFLSMRRSELFGTIDFLANCGGLLGLFLGFSFLSLIEIFYFLTLRLYCTLKNDLKEEKVKSETENVVQVEKY